MMSMPKGVTALEKESQRKMRSVVILVFFSGLILGMGIGQIRFQHFHIVWEEMQIPANRWWAVGWDVLAGVCGALVAWIRWRKISSR
jgi:hypothetical protein